MIPDSSRQEELLVGGNRVDDDLVALQHPGDFHFVAGELPGLVLIAQSVDLPLAIHQHKVGAGIHTLERALFGGATHHVMVKLYDNSNNQPVKEAVGKVKVIGPDKKEQVNGLKNYNGIFAANFTFNKKDKYGVICLVKINGEKHLFKFWYPHE